MPSMPEELSKDNTLVIIGDEDVVAGFCALGFKVYAAGELPEVERAIEEAVKSKAVACLVQDNFYNAKQEQIDKYKNLPLPIFIPFSKSARTDLLDDIVKNIRIRATGAF